MEAEATEAIGAAPYERTDTRVTSRNGVREREWDTRVGTIELAIPKLRQGSYFSLVAGATHWSVYAAT
jgi:transposase-like protein